MEKGMKKPMLLALFIWLGICSTFAQMQVTGKVVDEKTGETLPSVTVTVKGITTTGVITSLTGDFSITIPESAEKILVFRFMGYQTLELKAAPKMDVKMKLEATALDAVVITGMGVIDRGSYVGSISQVNLESIIVPSEISIDNMLQGAVAGMLVTTESGQVGSSAKISIRGTTTLLGNQEPLWVVDGVVQRDPLPVSDRIGDAGGGGDFDEMRELAANAISWLNPNDIETLTVLKDASATAIYGSQAGNGVIVITTKKATAGVLSVSYSGNFSVGQKPKYAMYDLMNSQELMQFSKEMYDSRYSYTNLVLPIGYAGLVQRLQNKEIGYDEYVAEFRKMENMNTDWFDLLFRNTFNHSHNISLSGGSDLVTNRTSFGVQENYGEAYGNEQKALSATSNTTIRLAKDRVIINLNVAGSLNSTAGFSFGVNPFNYAYNSSRAIPMYNEDETLFYHAETPTKRGSNAFNENLYYLYNIQNEMDNTGTTSKTQSARSTIDIEVKLLENLRFQSLLNYTVSATEGRSWATEFSNYIAGIRGYEYGAVLPNSVEQHSSYIPFGGLLRMDNAISTQYTFRNNLVYQKNFAKVHGVTVQAGVEMRSSKMNGNRTARYGYQHFRGQSFAVVPATYLDYQGIERVNPLHEEMGNSTQITNTVNNYLSEYFTAVYNYDQRYVVNFNARLDASNRFGQDQNKRFAPNWSTGLKWRIGNEKFMDFLIQKRWLDMVDISFSYGFTGNTVESVGPDLIARIPTPSLSSSHHQYVLNIRSLPYPDLGWERTNDWNLGIDFSFFDRRMSAVISAYGRKSDILGVRAVPMENGLASAIIIGNKMENQGFDLMVNLVPIRTKNFTWNLSFNTGLAKNKVTDIQSEYTYDQYLNGTAVIQGQPHSTFYSFAYKGVNGTNGFPMFYFMDTLGTGKVIDPQDFLVVSGKTQPDFFGGLNTMFRYKNFSLRAQFSVEFGAQRRLPSFYLASGVPTPDQNLPRILQNRWKNPGDEAISGILPGVPGPRYLTEYWLPMGEYTESLYTMYNNSDALVANASFIRCRGISMSYDLPKQVTQIIHIKRATVSFNLSNPFLIAFDKDWRGYDPGTGGWPARRTTSLSLNVSF